MKRFEGLVLCSDVDGTLIDEHNSVPKENLEAIQYFRAHGGKFTLATGRIPEAVTPVLHGITLDFPCICHNGCSIYDFYTNRYIDTVELPKEAHKAAEQVIELSPDTGVEVITPEGIFVVKQTFATDRHIAFEKITARRADSLEEVPAPWLKILFAQEPDKTDRLNEQMRSSAYHANYTIIKTHQYYYEIYHKNASKGNALETLCAHFNIDLKNVAAIGDNENDLSMLLKAGISAAAGNAPGSVKTKAGIVTCANSQGAVADFISKL